MTHDSGRLARCQLEFTNIIDPLAVYGAKNTSACSSGQDESVSIRTPNDGHGQMNF